MRLSWLFSRFRVCSRAVGQLTAAFGGPFGVALYGDVAVPDLDRIHHLASVFHHDGLVEENHWICGSQLVGTAQVIERHGTVELAVGCQSPLVICGSRIGQQFRGCRADRNQAIEYIDGRIVPLVQHVGSSLQFEQPWIFRRLL